MTVNSGGYLGLNDSAGSVGSLAGAGNVNLNNGTLTAGGNNSSTVFGGVMSGGGGFIKAGSGTMTLGGNSTYAGPTLISGGVLKLGGGAASAIAGPIDAPNATIYQADPSTSFTVSPGHSNEVLVFQVSWRGPAANENVTPPATIAWDGQTLQLAVAEANQVQNGLNGREAAIYYLYNPTPGSGTFSGFSGALTANGAATNIYADAFTLSGVNTSIPPLTVGAENSGGASTTATITGAAAGSTAVIAQITNQEGTTAFAVTAGAGTVQPQLWAYEDATSATVACGLITGLSAGTNTFTATPAAAEGDPSKQPVVVAVFAPAAASGGSNILPATTALTIASGATFDLGGGTQTVASLSGLTGSTIQNSGSSAAVLTLSATGGSAFSGLIAGGGGLGSINLVVAGSGSLNLGGSNSYTGSTQVTGGTLQLGNANAIGTSALAANGGVFDMAGFSITVPSFSGAAGVVTTSVAQPVVLTVVQSGTTAFGGTLQNGAGTLSLVLNGGSGGLLNLSGANTYSGGTQILAGVLQLGSSTALGNSAGTLTVTSGGLLDMNGLSANAGA